MSPSSESSKEPDGSVEFAKYGPTVEVCIAEVETRLREALVRMIRPCLSQISDIEMKLTRMETDVSSIRGQLELTSSLRLEVQAAREQMDSYQEAISKNEAHLRFFEMTINQSLDKMQIRQTEVRSTLEDLVARVGQGARETSRLWEETEELRRAHDEGKSKLWDAMAHTRKLSEKSCAELSFRVVETSTRIDQLLDQLFGEEVGLAKMQTDISALQSAMTPLLSMQDDVAHCTNVVKDLEARVCSTESTCSSLRVSWQEAARLVEKRCTECTEAMNSLCNRFTAHHGALMQQMRSGYTEELATCRRMREEVLKEGGRADGVLATVRFEMDSQCKRMESLHRALAAEMEDQSRLRRKDRLSVDGEMQEVRRHVQEQADCSANFGQGLDSLRRLVGLLVESERLSTAMCAQDFVDRLAERWPTPLQSSRKPEPAVGFEGLLHLRLSKELQVHTDVKGPQLDGYLPGAVSFCGVQYERRDALVLRHKLLQRAAALNEWEKAPRERDVEAKTVHLPSLVKSRRVVESKEQCCTAR